MKDGENEDAPSPEGGRRGSAKKKGQAATMRNSIDMRGIDMTSPLGRDVVAVRFDELFSLSDIQRIQDEFAAATGVASIITHPDGTPITAPSRFTRLCKDIVRKTEKGCANCYKSDAALGAPRIGAPIVQPCLSGGLWDAGTCITVGGHHIANWLIGQVRDETQTDDSMLAYARQIGADEKDFIKAFHEVPSMSRKRFGQVAQVLYTLGNMLSNSAYQNVRQAHFIADLKRADEEVLRLNAELEQRVRERTLELAGSLSLLRATIESTSEGILAVDNSRKITCLNRRFVEMLRLPGDIGVSSDVQILYDFLLPQLKEPERILALRKDLLEHIEKASSDIMELKDGRVFERNSLPQRIEDQIVGRVWRCRDITKRLELENQLQQAQKLEAVGQLAAGVAHEINTPIQFISDNLHFLKDSSTQIANVLSKIPALLEAAKAQPATKALALELERAITNADLPFIEAELPKAIQQSIEGAERVAEIVRAMKEFAHPDEGTGTAFSLNKAIETTVTVARNAWKYSSDMRLELASDLPDIHGHQGQINQVILNLIVNASDAIATALKARGGDAKGLITIRTKDAGDCVEMSISDTGCGIPASCQKRIFDPFFTTKEVGKGSGQGLAMAYNAIVKRHGGTIRFDTEVNVGTTFHVTLPKQL